MNFTLKDISIKSIKARLEDRKAIFLIVYLFLVISTCRISKWDGSKLILLILECLIILAILIIICPLVLKKVAILKITIRDITVDSKQKVLWLSSFFVLSFSILFCWYLAYYPGRFPGDTIYQYKQALSGQYNDWKPILQTLITFTFPLKMTGRVDTIILFQIIEYACVLTYMAYIILKYSNKRFAVATLLYILCNPVTGNIVVFPWKDVTFTMFALLLMLFGMQIYITNGRWIEKKTCLLSFIICLIFATVIRHNAFLFTIPLLIAVLFYIGKKRCIQIIIFFVAGVILIKGPIYGKLEVYEYWNYKTRLLGVPLSMLGNVMKESPESLDDRTKEFMNALAPEDMWKEVYICGNFNSIKWQVDQTLIEKTGIINVVSMAIESVFRAPLPALKGMFGLMDMVYAIDGRVDWDIVPYISANEFEWESLKIDERDGLEKYTEFSKISFLKYFFWYVGVVNLVIIVSILCKCISKSKENLKRGAFAIPILCYNFGTMLLLSGNDFRYFYPSFPILPIILLILYGEKSEALE